MFKKRKRREIEMHVKEAQTSQDKGKGDNKRTQGGEREDLKITDGGVR